MKRVLAVIAVSTIAAGGAFAQAEKQGAMKGQKVSQAQCESLWNQANPQGATSISLEKARDLITDVKAVNPDNDQTIERSEFMNACDRGLIKSGATTGAGAGTAGAGQEQQQQKQQQQKY